ERPLSFAQERLWFLHQLEPGSVVYHRPTNLRLRGLLNVPALERALNEVVRRHDVLRSCFSSDGRGPFQRAAEQPPLSLVPVDLTGVPAARSEVEARGLARAEGRQPFHFETGPPVRAGLLRLGSEDHVLLLTVHHIVFDGWSEGVLHREL